MATRLVFVTAIGTQLCVGLFGIGHVSFRYFADRTLERVFQLRQPIKSQQASAADIRTLQTDFGDNPKPPQFILGRSDAKAARRKTPLILRRYFAPSSTYSLNVGSGYQAFRGSTLSLVERTVPTSSTAVLSQASVAERLIALPPELGSGSVCHAAISYPRSAEVD